MLDILEQFLHARPISGERIHRNQLFELAARNIFLGDSNLNSFPVRLWKRLKVNSGYVEDYMLLEASGRIKARNDSGLQVLTNEQGEKVIFSGFRRVEDPAQPPRDHKRLQLSVNEQHFGHSLSRLLSSHLLLLPTD
jgi:hypothetical protein